MNMKYSSSLYKFWMRFLTWIGDIMLATEPPRIKAEHIRLLMKNTKLGDVIFRKYNYYLDSYFIKGKYTHSGCFYMRDYDGNPVVGHALAEGCQNDDMIDFVKDCDGFLLFRPDYSCEEGPKNMESFRVFVNKHVRKRTPYDGLFDQKDGLAFYCHEFTAKALNSAGFQVKSKTSIIYAEDILNSVNGHVVLEC